MMRETRRVEATYDRRGLRRSVAASHNVIGVQEAA